MPHNIEKLQKYLDFLFFKVWCKAKGNFDANKLDGFPELKQIYIDLGNTEGEWADFFNKSIENIYKEFLNLDNNYKKQLISSYKNNNNIEGLCNDKTISPITYDNLKSKHPDLAKELKAFYSKIYGSKSPFNLEIFGFLNKKLIADYDTKFMTANDKGVCPFCGINHLKGNNHSYREAYDHYIPKGIYPFNALNFKNLAPMCNECNSTYKLTKVPVFKKNEKNINPILKKNNRKLAFYPYSNIHPSLTFSVELLSKDLANLKPKDIKLEIKAHGYDEQIESWLRVFGLDERYKALLCSPSDGKAWINSIIDGYDNAVAQGSTLTRKQYFEAQLIDAKHILISEKGFLKSVFLEECKRKGVFKSV